MAQAARLNLRMQKELKLLLTDPPPGASFPHSDLSSFSLSTIHAEIEGPEGTVYEKGRFKIKIQIPERYPFQPPVVTFTTPIYHPNIDTGGRICLDILNLPPKGAWQPSLNISTVLTSIGLLLCEPNPDDGLMCEASREYKYDRQTFDHKARSMTEKYGKSGAIEEESDLQSRSTSPMMESKGSELDKNDIKENSVRFNTLSGIRRKLSLESSGSSLRDHANKRVDEVSSDHIGNQLQVLEAKQESEDVSNKYSQNHEKLHRKRQNLSMGLLGPNHDSGGDEKENVNPNQGTTTTALTPQSIPLESLESSPVLQPSKQHQNQPHYLLHHHKDLKSRPNSSAKLSHFGQKRSHENIKSDERTEDCENNKIPKESTNEPDLNVVKGNFLVPRGITFNESAIEAPKGSAHDKSCFTIPKRKKLGLAGKKPSVGVCALVENSESCNKGDIALNSFGVLPKLSLIAKSTGTNDGHVTSKKMLQPKPLDQLEGTNGCDIFPSEPTGDAQKQECDHNEVFCGGIKQSGEELCVSEEVIVLDSEDSEEEKEKASKLSIARRRALGKWRAKS